MALIGLLLSAAGVALLVLSGNEEVVRWVAENSTCNDRPCTEDEARGIVLVGGVVALMIGVPLTIAGLVRLVRGRDAGPDATAGAGGPASGGSRPERTMGGPEPGMGSPQPTVGAPGPRDRWGARGERPVTVEKPRYESSPLSISGDPAEQIARLDQELAEGRLTAEEYQKRRKKLLSKL